MKVPFRHSILGFGVAVAIACLISLVLGWNFADELGSFRFTVIKATLFIAGAISAITSLVLCRMWLRGIASEVGMMTSSTSDGTSPVDWYCGEVEFFDFRILNLLSGLVLGAFATYVYVQAAFIESQNQTVLVAGYLALFLCCFVASSALCTLARGALFLRAFAKTYSFRLTEHNFGVLALGRVILYCYAMIVLTVALYQSTAIISEGGGQSVLANLGSAPMLLIGYPVAVFLFVTFISIQWPFHDKLKAAKIEMIADIERRLRSIKPIERGYDEKDLEAIKYLNEELRRTNNMPEWPCKLRGQFSGGILSLAGLLAGPVIDQVIGLVKSA